ncbi:LysR family transcriptional regulator [Sphaerisporangium corydalis]|uniref:LysR family transcriptional regulator n=1 Tax=Sphaerisporangium corydalis TaxID=1441875 RepID=A0ABV9EL69_9ACTN|nr:LysR family transcriptional regulator [Sphaerisporangium corydalis]
MELDLGAIRTFLDVVEDGRFTDAAARVGMSQQAVSKRIAKLEGDLGAPLLVRSRTGVRPTADGEAFLPHARALISLADQAAAMLRARRRPLRVDVLGRDSASIDMVRAFYEGGDADVEIVVSRGAVPRAPALTGGSVDAAFGRATGVLPPGIARVPACLEPIPILVGRRHRLARRERVRMEELSGLTAWMPGNAGDSEWADYYRLLSAEFGVRIDSSGPFFGRDHIAERVAASPELITFGNKRQYPVSPDVVEVTVTDPTPVYPWSLMWHEANRHPSLPLLVAHITDHYRPLAGPGHWLPVPDRSLFPADPEPAL